MGDVTNSAPFVVLSVVVAAFAATRLAGWVIRSFIRRVARRRLLFPDRAESGEEREQRRRQRVDAAARMVQHLTSVVVWVVATIVMFHLLDVDPAFFLSSAGFIGAAIAIGGQHKVSDYLTGLSVHFEDRYGVGDEVEVDQSGREPVRAMVDHIGLFTTRLRDERGTLHLPNGALANVRNLSQEPAVATIRLQVPDPAAADEAAAVLRELAGTEGLTDVVFVGDLSARPTTGEVAVEVRTTRALDARSRERLARRAEAALDRRVS